MKIDNFDIFRAHLTFLTPQDRYVIHVLRRPKDVKQIGNSFGSNECQRLLRTYYIDSLEYFDRKIPAIKELCESNRARAYILPQVRNNEDCLMNLAMKVMETIRNKNYSAKPEHLLRSAYCDNHQSRDKVWVLDLDSSEMYGWTLEQVKQLVSEKLAACGKDPAKDMYVIQTKNGHHVITKPFNLQDAYKSCSMFYEGEKKFFSEDGTKVSRVGWLHKDGMSLLYLNLPD